MNFSYYSSYVMNLSIITMYSTYYTRLTESMNR